MCTSAPNCPRAMWAKSCVARCAMNYAKPPAPAPGNLRRRRSFERYRPAPTPVPIDVGRDAVPEIEHVARARPVAAQHRQGFCAQCIRGAKSAAGSRLPCRATRPSTASRAAARSVVQSTPTASQPMAQFSATTHRALGEHYIGYPAPLRLASKGIHHLGHVSQGEFLVLRRRQHASPGIEQHHRLSTAAI